MTEHAQLSLELPGHRDAYSVSDIAGGLRELVETAYDDVLVEGELSDFKQHRSGHCYFTLKDENARLNCVMWRSFTKYVFFEPQNGMLVRVRGKISVYEARGSLQLVARSMRVSGDGALQQAFDELKRKLSAEGLFDTDRKRPIPAFPERIGLVTSAAGAAYQDILSVIERRFPVVEVVLFSVQVQGMGASAEIAEAIEAFNELNAAQLPIDVLIVGRGGGSTEDLWAFNEEVVARAMAASDIPIVSAVGHETDFTIADFVADRRAATPSMGAEIVVPDQRALNAWLRGTVQATTSSIQKRIDGGRQTVRHLLATHAFHRPADRLRRLVQRRDDLEAQLHRAATRTLERHRARVEAGKRQLDLLDPSLPLDRGYARVERDGSVVRAADELAVEDELKLTFRDGSREVRVTS